MGKRKKQKQAEVVHEPAHNHLPDNKPESIALKIYSSVGAVVAGIIARKVIEKTWVKATGKTPPDDPHSPTVPLREAVGWSLASGSAVAIARLLATRKAAGAWQRVSRASAASDDR
ncbi:MAG: DUF4235 domain-containing protein [Acidothermaceae bacterium]